MYFHSVLHCTSIWVFVPALTNEEMEVKLPDSVACSDLCLSTQRAYSRSRLQICLSTQHASGFHPYTPKTPIVLLLPPPYFTEMGYIYIAVEKIVFFMSLSKSQSTFLLTAVKLIVLLSCQLHSSEQMAASLQLVVRSQLHDDLFNFQLAKKKHFFFHKQIAMYGWENIGG